MYLQQGSVVAQDITEEGIPGWPAGKEGAQDPPIWQHKPPEQLYVMDAGEVGDIHAAAADGPCCGMHGGSWVLTAQACLYEIEKGQTISKAHVKVQKHLQTYEAWWQLWQLTAKA